jgi:outer membrane biosynthesis protein TonB
VERRLAVHARAHGEAVIARWSLALALVLASSTAAAAPKGADARAHFDKGVAAYTKGDYAAAAEALGASFVIEADVETLFAWAQTERKLGHCDRAIDLYKKLLAMNLPAENKQAVQVQIDECKAVLAEKPKKAEPKPKVTKGKPEPKPVEVKPVEPAPVEPAPVVAPTPIQTPPPVEHEARAWWKDPVGGVLVGAGVIGMGVGAVFLVQGSNADGTKEMAPTYSSYEERANRAESLGRRGVIGLAIGGALVAGGVVWYATRGKSGERRVSTVVVPSGAGVAVSGSF